MTREALLNASVKAYEDKQNQAYAYKFSRAITKQGYSYITIDYKTKRAITCAIHLATQKDNIEGLSAFVAQRAGTISTRQPLAHDEMVMYKDYFLFWHSYTDFNETMGQYSYEVSALPPNDRILLSKITDVYGNTSYDKVAPIPTYTILPYYADLSNEDFANGVILLECTDSKGVSITRYNPLKKSLSQQRTDEVVFTLLNMTRQQSLKFITDIQEYSLASQDFGFIELPYITDETYIDKSNAIKAIISKIYAKISYNLTSDYNDNADKIIRTVIYKCYNVDLPKEENDGKE